MPEWHDLNARHVATIFWGGIFVIALTKSSSARSSVSQLLKLLMQLQIALPIIGLLACVAILTNVFLTVGRIVGFWETLPILTATIWFFTAGFSLLFDLQEFFEGRNEFRRRAVGILGPSILIAEVVSIPVFELWQELILIPVLFILTYIVAQDRRPALRKTCRGLLSGRHGSWSSYQILFDPSAGGVDRLDQF